MRVFGHPIHPLLVHFPTALLPMDIALSWLFHLRGEASFYSASAYCLWAGTALGLVAVATGLIDLVLVSRSEKAALVLGLYHGVVNGMLLLVFGILAYRSYQQFPAPVFVSVRGLLLKCVLVLALFTGNYLGGRLIYNHRVGIRTN